MSDDGGGPAPPTAGGHRQFSPPAAPNGTGHHHHHLQPPTQPRSFHTPRHPHPLPTAPRKFFQNTGPRNLPARPQDGSSLAPGNGFRRPPAMGGGKARSPGPSGSSSGASVGISRVISPASQSLKKTAYSEDVYSVLEESMRNDLNQAYLNTGRRSQNLLQGVELEERFSEYPKLAKLLECHSTLVDDYSIPPTYLQADLRSYPLTDLLPTKFDCILIDAPLEEYSNTYPTRCSGPSDFKDGDRSYWTWEELGELPIPQVANNPGFIWIWVGSGRGAESGLEKGRELLAKWGYRRCEDIVWLKTNKLRPGLENEPSTSTLLTQTKEHCLMGIRGTVRRSTDGHLVHCNIDTDVIVWENPDLFDAPEDYDPLRKPPELYHLIENFCTGTRRLELFGNKNNLRRGWLTVGNELEDKSEGEARDQGLAGAEPYAKETFDNFFIRELMERGGNVVPTTAEVDNLRPRSPNGSKATPLVPGLKVNPQGIGRHTNRSATPSASQQLELQQAQQAQQAQAQAHAQAMLLQQQAMQAQMLFQQEQARQREREQQQHMLQMQQQMMMGGGMMGNYGTGQGGMGVDQFQLQQQQFMQMMNGVGGHGHQMAGMGVGMPGMSGDAMGQQQQQMWNGYTQHQQQQYPGQNQGNGHMGQFY